MIQAYTLNSSGIVYPIGSTITFENTKIKTECTSLVDSNTKIRIKKAGRYLIQFDGLMGGDASLVTVQMNNNGIPVTDAITEAYSTDVASPMGISMSTIVQVLPSCCSVDNTANLTFTLPNAVTLYKANVVVTRLCQ